MYATITTTIMETIFLKGENEMKKYLDYAIMTISVGVTILQGVWVIKSLKVNERIAKAEERIAEALEPEK